SHWEKRFLTSPAPTTIADRIDRLIVSERAPKTQGERPHAETTLVCLMANTMPFSKGRASAARVSEAAQSRKADDARSQQAKRRRLGDRRGSAVGIHRAGS